MLLASWPPWFLRVALATPMIAVLVLAAIARYVDHTLNSPLQFGSDQVVIEVQRGDSLNRIATRLADDNMVAATWPLRVYCRFVQDCASIKAGEYAVPQGTTMLALVERFGRGDVIEYALLVVEGSTAAEMLQQLQSHPLLHDDIPSDLAAMRETLPMPDGVTTLEGLLFPDTYRFHKGQSALALVQQARQRMQQVLDTAWEQRAKDLPYKSAYEALIMASLIEKETGAPEERKQIAGVFVRRLQQDMLLQTDPTIIYGLGEDFDGNLRKAHLLDENNPYNTYRHRGLPPSPIALPGQAAIQAALHPEDGETLYFVARGDGTHAFSVTLDEHQRAVRTYQIQKRSKTYTSSPPAAPRQ